MLEGEGGVRTSFKQRLDLKGFHLSPTMEFKGYFGFQGYQGFVLILSNQQVRGKMANVTCTTFYRRVDNGVYIHCLLYTMVLIGLSKCLNADC